MHCIDAVNDQMLRSVMSYAESRLRMDPVPLDRGELSPSELNDRLQGLIRESPRHPDEVLGTYASVVAPTVVSADSPRFLGFIPCAPTKASLAFDMVVSCASIHGISWLEASGAIAAENSVLRVLADEAGLPPTSGGCFVSGGSAGNLSALAVARDAGRRRTGDRRQMRAVVGSEAHSSIRSTLRLLDMDALVVQATDHRLTGEAVAHAVSREADLADIAAVVCTSGTTNAGIVDDLLGVGVLARENGWWFHVDGAYGGAGILAPSLKQRYAGLELADSFIVNPHKWLFSPFDSCALIYRDPDQARLTHTQDAAYLDAIHGSSEEWNPTDYAYHLTRRARGLPLWFSLAVNGIQAYRDAIESSVELARRTARLVTADPHLELVREPELGVVLFRRLGWKPSDYEHWADWLHAEAIAFAPPTKWEGETVARLAFLHPATDLDLVKMILKSTH